MNNSLPHFLFLLFIILLLPTVCASAQQFTYSQKPANDAWVEQLNPTTNYSTDLLYVGSDPGGELNHTFLQWDLASIISSTPTGMVPVVDSAQIKIYQWTNNNVTAAAYLKEVISPWLETTVTWNTMPMVPTTSFASVNFTANSMGWIVWDAVDISNLVQNWIDGTNYGLAIYAKSSSTGYQSFKNAENVIDEPILKVWGRYELPNLIKGREKLGADFVIYPNPCLGIFTIEAGINDVSLWNISISDLGGRVIHSLLMENQSNESRVEVDVSFLNPGVYVVTLYGHKYVGSQRMCIVR